MVKIAVIGAGVVGSLIARDACRYAADVHLFESFSDVGWGVTKANSAIIHGGFHDAPGTVRATFCRSGNEAFSELCEQLDVPFERCGAYVLAFNPEEEAALETLRMQGESSGVGDLSYHTRDEVLAQEPNVNPSVSKGLWCPSVGITEPWALAIAATENARANGLILHLSERITEIQRGKGASLIVRSPEGAYEVDAVINAAGLHADQVSAMAGVPFPEIKPRRGEYVLLDKRLDGHIHSVLFPAPDEMSKGILVLPTIDGGILLGPNAEDLGTDSKHRVDTTSDGLTAVINGALRLVPTLDLSCRTKTFAGLRPETPDGDFVVGPTVVRGFYQAAGMRSPGLTAAPSIATWLTDKIAFDFKLSKKLDFVPNREAIPRTSQLTDDTLDKLIAVDPSYGRVVCYCNQVTEGEIVEAIRRGARSLDAVKFRTRAGFGRCQGGSCTARILQLLARELQTSRENIPLNEPESWIVSGEVRQ